MSEQIKHIEKARELLDKIPYVKDFHSDDKDTLSKICFFREYQKDEVIIQEEAPNQELFFLIRGTVDIKIKNKHIISLKGGGRIFGEMSFVNHAYTAASVISQNEATMMVFKIPGILMLESDKYARLKIDFYRSIAEMLAQKLKATTDLASQYKSQLSIEEEDTDLTN